jgi:hypothetical protein
MQEDIKTFVDQIFSINPTVSMVYGSALSVGSRDMAGGGISNSASDTVFKLREETASMAELLLLKDDQNKSALEAKSKNIEGYLMMLQTIGQISDQSCNDLINKLQSIIKK